MKNIRTEKALKICCCIYISLTFIVFWSLFILDHFSDIYIDTRINIIIQTIVLICGFICVIYSKSRFGIICSLIAMFPQMVYFLFALPYVFLFGLISVFVIKGKKYKSRIIKILILIIVVFLLFQFLAFIVGAGFVTNVKTTIIPSPDDYYVAVLTEYYEFGKHTYSFVGVEKNKYINAMFFNVHFEESFFSKRYVYKNVYLDDTSIDNLDMEWISDTELSVNDIVYNMREYDN